MTRQPSKNKAGQTVVFLGDSITAEGTFIAFVQASLLQRMPGYSFTLINLGLPSETVSGLSEPDHPFPRPCVLERIDRELQTSEPDWVILCYGMNDGIYAPFSPARFHAYQKGMLEAIQRVRCTGARAIAMTPPPFDAASSGGVLLADGLAEETYSYKTPYGKYNDIVKAYANWLVSLEVSVVEVVNIYDELQQAIEQSRQRDPRYVSGDGIHPNADGHFVIAQTLLRQLF